VKIVFIKNNPEAHNFVYVNELEDAVRLSNRMRLAADIVRVINNRDELYAEWANGSPSDAQYDIPRLLGSYAEESYDYSNFEDIFDDDGNLVFANELPTRLHELSSMLQMAFDTALQQNDYNEHILAWQDHEEDPKMLGLIREALDLGERQPDLKPDDRAHEISEWMSDGKRNFLPLLVEYVALKTKYDEVRSYDPIMRFGVALAEWGSRAMPKSW